MNFLSEWITNIILFILLATIIELLLPNSSMQKYVKMVIGLLLIVIILSPILTLLSTDMDRLFASMELKSQIEEKNIENSIEIKKKEIQASQRAYILEQMAVQMKSEIEEGLVQKYGLTIEKILLSTNKEKEDVMIPEDILAVEVILTDGEVMNETVSVVKTVKIDASKPAVPQVNEEMDEKEIRTFLANKWEMDSEKIVVLLEGGKE